MLIETVKNYDKNNKLIKLVSIDILRNKGQNIPPQITHVPALVIPSEKQVFFGKNVFDYLLLPNSGILLSGNLNTDDQQNNNQSNNNKNNDDLISFSFKSSSGFSDNYATIEDDNSINSGFEDRNYSWKPFDNTEEDIVDMLPIAEETKKNKESFDLDKYKRERDLELKKNDLNKFELPIPKNPRD
jgi:hypothetical protein